MIHQVFSFEPEAVDLHFFKAAVLIYRYASVIKQIAVDSGIQSPMTVEKFNMGLKFFGIQESCRKRSHHFFFSFSQPVRVVGIKSWKAGIPERPFDSFYFHSPLF